MRQVNPEASVMQAWLRSVVDTMLGRVSGKIRRLDTATRMAMDADFSAHGEPTAASQPRRGERDDGHLVKRADPLGVDPLDELFRMVAGSSPALLGD
jgi:hypothetical protein